MAVRKIAPVTAAPAPFDIAALEQAVGAANVRWPVAHAEIRRLNSGLQGALIDLIRQVEDEDARDMLVIAANALLISLLTNCAAALTARRARERGLAFAFGGPSLASALLEGGFDGPDPVFALFAARFEAALRPSPRHPPWRLAHRLITNRGPGWFWRAPVAVLNHNALLQSCARADRRHRFAYVTAGQLFGADGADTPPPQVKVRLRDLGAELASRARGRLNGMGCAVEPFFTDGLRERLSGWLIAVAGHRARLARTWHRPAKELWTGTGGNYVSRLARAAVRRAGGSVTAFEHGGGMHIHADATAQHLQEFVLADRFVADTPAKAAIFGEALDPAKSVDGAPPEILSRPDGGASLPWLNGAAAETVRTVMYVTTAFVGELQYPLQPLLPDVVYADWQGRLMDGLADQGFRVLCKQHPQSMRGGRPFETSAKAEYLGGLFHDCLDRADAFVFDYPATTSLWEAICTEKPVVFLDLGLTEWRPEVRREFEKRCAVVPAGFDEWNRPRVDFARVGEALMSAPFDDGFAEKYLTGRPRR